jgi:CcmD family protein
MKDLKYLFMAYTVIWAGVGLYLARLAVLRSGLQRRLARLEERSEDRGAPHG